MFSNIANINHVDFPNDGEKISILAKEPITSDVNEMFNHNQLLLLFFIRYYKYHSHNSFEQNVSELNVIKYLQTRTRFIPPMSLWLREKATLCYNVK